MNRSATALVVNAIMLTVAVTACAAGADRAQDTGDPATTGAPAAGATTVMPIEVSVALPTTSLLSTTSPPSTTPPLTTNPPPSTTTTSAPPQTTTTPPTPPPDDRALTVDALAFVPVLLEQRGGYERDLFGARLDEDDDGCNTRQEVMSRDAIEIEERAGCRVAVGTWRSRYDGVDVDRSQDLEVDHLVSLKEAWDSGAWSWTREQRSAFANDLRDGRGLRAVTIASNRSKGDNVTSNWVPSDRRSV
ncbi:MAG: hypothetical protein WKF45_04700 [Ilumatobacteraceae bacterium]